MGVKSKGGYGEGLNLYLYVGVNRGQRKTTRSSVNLATKCSTKSYDFRHNLNLTRLRVVRSEACARKRFNSKLKKFVESSNGLRFFNGKSRSRKQTDFPRKPTLDAELFFSRRTFRPVSYFSLYVYTDIRRR